MTQLQKNYNLILMETKKELKEIIDTNAPLANEGHKGSMQMVINAQTQLDELAKNELATAVLVKLFSL